MKHIAKVTDSVYYLGVNDRSKPLFENMWPLPNGVSYNSYLIVDTEVVLIDTVDVCYSDTFFHRIDTILGDRPIDYLIVNHMEPDHGGSIGLLKNRYPNIKIVGNKKTFDMLKGYHGIEDNLIEVKGGDALKVGSHEFSFLMATMVHWPEVMFTYEQSEKILFSADAFGSFGALNGHVLDYEAGDISMYLDEMHRYYSCIVGKYGKFVQKVFESLSKLDLDIKYICSTHGLVWTEKYFQTVYNIYDKLSKYEGEDGAVIIYGSMYGNNEQVADIIARSLSVAGVKNIVCHNVSFSDPSVILRDVFKYKAVIIGSPTYCGDVFSPIKNILEMIRIREVKDRYYSVFGSFTWAPMAVKKLVPFAEEMGWEFVGEAVELKMADVPAVADAAWQIGQDMAKKLNEK